MILDKTFSWPVGNTSFYVRKNENLKLEEVKLTSVRYGFFEGRLSDILIETKGRKNWLALKSYCFHKFGKGFKENYFIENYRWSGNITTLVLEYKEKEDLGILFMKSEMMHKEMILKLREKKTSGE